MKIFLSLVDKGELLNELYLFLVTYIPIHKRIVNKEILCCFIDQIVIKLDKSL